MKYLSYSNIFLGGYYEPKCNCKQEKYDVYAQYKRSYKSSYQMKVDKYKRLLHTWYGEKISGAEYLYLIEILGRGFLGNLAGGTHAN